MIKVGIIGCGKVAQVRHIPEYQASKKAEIAGYYDINSERAQNLAQEYGGAAFSSADELFYCGEIDAVSICSANRFHGEYAVAALNAGKHVLCEKPMGISLEECEKMVEASEKNKRILMIGHNQRFTRAHRKAKQLIEDGVIGDILTFRTAFRHGGPESWSVDGKNNLWFFDRARAGMGVMADLGIHKTDLIQYLTGQTIIETEAVMAALHKKDSQGNPISVEDNAICIYRMENGVIGTMSASWTCYGKEDNATVLYGTDGVLSVYEDPVYPIKVETSKGETILFQMEQIQTNENQTSSGIIDEFLDAVLTGRQPETSGKEILKTMRAAFASERSAKEGRAIKI